MIIVLCLVEARPDNEIQNALDGGRRRGDRDRRRDRERGRQDDRDDRDRRRDRERERDRDRDDDEEPDDDFDNDVNALPSDRQRDRSDRERDRGDRERSRGDRDRQRDRGDRDQDRDRSRGRERDRGRERQRERERERQSDGQCTDRPKNFGCDLEPICRSGETLSVTFNTTCDKPIFKIARHGHDDNDKDDRKRRRRDECIDTEVVEEVEDTDADVTVDGREFDAYESERSSNHRRRGNRRGRRDKGGLKELKRLCRDVSIDYFFAYRLLISLFIGRISHSTGTFSSLWNLLQWRKNKTVQLEGHHEHEGPRPGNRNFMR